MGPCKLRPTNDRNHFPSIDCCAHSSHCTVHNVFAFREVSAQKKLAQDANTSIISLIILCFLVVREKCWNCSVSGWGRWHLPTVLLLLLLLLFFFFFLFWCLEQLLVGLMTGVVTAYSTTTFDCASVASAASVRKTSPNIHFSRSVRCIPRGSSTLFGLSTDSGCVQLNIWRHLHCVPSKSKYLILYSTIRRVVFHVQSAEEKKTNRIDSSCITLAQTDIPIQFETAVCLWQYVCVLLLLLLMSFLLHSFWLIFFFIRVISLVSSSLNVDMCVRLCDSFLRWSSHFYAPYCLHLGPFKPDELLRYNAVIGSAQ